MLTVCLINHTQTLVGSQPDIKNNFALLIVVLYFREREAHLT